MPIAAKCALRWRSHAKQMNQLVVPLGGRLYRVDYKELVLNPKETIGALMDFLGVRAPDPLPEVSRGSLERWRKELNPKECEQIERIADVSLESVAI